MKTKGFDFSKVRFATKEEMDQRYKEVVNAPLPEELIEIVKALADK